MNSDWYTRKPPVAEVQTTSAVVAIAVCRWTSESVPHTRNQRTTPQSFHSACFLYRCKVSESQIAYLVAPPRAPHFVICLGLGCFRTSPPENQRTVAFTSVSHDVCGRCEPPTAIGQCVIFVLVMVSQEKRLCMCRCRCGSWIVIRDRLRKATYLIQPS